MRLHERVPVVNIARREIEEAFDATYGVGAVIEGMCADVCEVEAKCLYASQYKLVSGPPDVYGCARVLWEIVLRLREKHGLTWGETARIVHHLSDHGLNWIIRYERHPDDPDKKADEA